MRSKLKYARFIGFFLFLFVLLKVDLRTILDHFRSIDPAPFAAGILILFVFHVSKALRWKYILGRQAIGYSVKDSYLMYAAGLYAGVITPGRLGDFIKALYLRADGHSSGRALSGVFLDRVIDLFFLALIALPSLVWIKLSSQADVNILGAVVFFGVMVAVLILISSRRLAGRLGNRFLALIPGRFKPSFKDNLDEFYASLDVFSLVQYTVIVLYTLAGWLIYFSGIHLFSRAIGLDLPFYQVIFFFVLSSIAAFIPASIAGIGTRDVTLLYFFPLLGYTKEAAISFSLIILFIYFLTALFGLIAWLIKPIKW